jgi:hypothetical protein
MLGTVAASSMQPYFSSVNQYFRDHKLPPIAVIELLADARHGLEMQQERLVPSDTRLSLPDPVTLDILLSAAKLRDTLAWTPASLNLIKLFRASLALCVNYTFFPSRRNKRPLPHRRPRRGPSLAISLSIRAQVQRGIALRHTLLLLAIPTPANPVLADLLDYHLRHRTAFCATYFDRPPSIAYAACHLCNPPQSGRPQHQFRHGWTSPSLDKNQPLLPASIAHRTPSAKARLPPLVASALPSPSSKYGWLGQE